MKKYEAKKGKDDRKKNILHEIIWDWRDSLVCKVPCPHSRKLRGLVICTRSSQSAFQPAVRSPAPTWGAMHSWWLLRKGESVFYKSMWKKVCEWLHSRHHFRSLSFSFLLTSILVLIEEPRGYWNFCVTRGGTQVDIQSSEWLTCPLNLGFWKYLCLLLYSLFWDDVDVSSLAVIWCSVLPYSHTGLSSTMSFPTDSLCQHEV